MADYPKRVPFNDLCKGDVFQLQRSINANPRISFGTQGYYDLNFHNIQQDKAKNASLTRLKTQNPKVLVIGNIRNDFTELHDKLSGLMQEAINAESR